MIFDVTLDVPKKVFLTEASRLGLGGVVREKKLETQGGTFYYLTINMTFGTSTIKIMSECYHERIKFVEWLQYFGKKQEDSDA